MALDQAFGFEELYGYGANGKDQLGRVYQKKDGPLTLVIPNPKIASGVTAPSFYEYPLLNLEELVSLGFNPLPSVSGLDAELSILPTAQVLGSEAVLHPWDTTNGSSPKDVAEFGQQLAAEQLSLLAGGIRRDTGLDRTFKELDLAISIVDGSAEQIKKELLAMVSPFREAFGQVEARIGGTFPKQKALELLSLLDGQPPVETQIPVVLNVDKTIGSNDLFGSYLNSIRRTSISNQILAKVFSEPGNEGDPSPLDRMLNIFINVAEKAGFKEILFRAAIGGQGTGKDTVWDTLNDALAADRDWGSEAVNSFAKVIKSINTTTSGTKGTFKPTANPKKEAYKIHGNLGAAVSSVTDAGDLVDDSITNFMMLFEATIGLLEGSNDQNFNTWPRSEGQFTFIIEKLIPELKKHGIDLNLDIIHMELLTPNQAKLLNANKNETLAVLERINLQLPAIAQQATFEPTENKAADIREFGIKIKNQLVNALTNKVEPTLDDPQDHFEKVTRLRMQSLRDDLARDQLLHEQPILATFTLLLNKIFDRMAGRIDKAIQAHEEPRIDDLDPISALTRITAHFNTTLPSTLRYNLQNNREIIAADLTPADAMRIYLRTQMERWSARVGVPVDFEDTNVQAFINHCAEQNEIKVNGVPKAAS